MVGFIVQFDALMILTYFLIVVNTLIFINWIYFLIAILRSFNNSPRLNAPNVMISADHKISIIVPARNEERSLPECLRSLLGQKYSNYEVIVINDCSTDRTLSLAIEISRLDGKLIVVDAPPKPPGWVGKNWACYQGYLHSSGDILFFTDADTIHSPLALTSALDLMLKEKLDAMSAVPKLACKNFLTRVTLPVLSVFLHSRYSPERVNSPKTSIGYFFGSFYLITRRTYEAVGTHKAVRDDLVEDGELGHRVKELKYRLKIVRGESQIEAEWARDSKSLWNALRRLILPLYIKRKSSALLMMTYLIFALLEPYFGLLFSLALSYPVPSIPDLVLLGTTLGTIILITIASSIQSRYGLFQNSAYGLISVVGCVAITMCFVVSILAKGNRRVSWKDRDYVVSSPKHGACYQV